MKTQDRPQSTNVVDRRPKTVEDIINQESFPNKMQSSQFLIDTFKRARETGFNLPPEVYKVSMLDPWMFAANGIKVPNGGTRQSPATNTTDKTPKTNLEIPALDYLKINNDNKKIG